MPEAASRWLAPDCHYIIFIKSQSTELPRIVTGRKVSATAESLVSRNLAVGHDIWSRAASF